MIVFVAFAVLALIGCVVVGLLVMLQRAQAHARAMSLMAGRCQQALVDLALMPGVDPSTATYLNVTLQELRKELPYGK